MKEGEVSKLFVHQKQQTSVFSGGLKVSPVLIE
jgi:hypothetical protein